MANELVPVPARRTLTPDTWQMIAQVAPVMHQSRLFAVSSPEAATAIMLKGYELGLGLTTSFEYINVVEGRPTLSPRGALALAIQSGQLTEFVVTDEADGQGKAAACHVRAARSNGMRYELRYTLEDARRTGQVKPRSAWETYPANMLRWRTIGFVLDVLFPDIQGGMKRADEFGADLDADGNVVEGQWSAVSAPKPAQPTDAQTAERVVVTDWPQPSTEPAPATQAETPVQALTLDDLLEHWTAEQILVANQGRIPGTEAELQACVAVLGGGAA